MVYLIAQLAAWLLLTMACAALAGWSFAAYRASEADAKARRDRTRLMRDLNLLVSEGASPDAAHEADRAREAVRSMADLRDARIAELERALDAARASADDAQARAAELERQLERMETEREQTPAIDVSAIDVEVEPAHEIEPVSAPQALVAEPQGDPSLQAWRLRYFEQRVRYLEGARREAEPAPAAPPPAPIAAPPLMEWRARIAETRAAHAENEVRALLANPAAETAALVEESDLDSPFAANPDVDMLLRWRMLYLERRLAHMNARPVLIDPDAETLLADAPQPDEPQLEEELADDGPDPECWKWRSRYLEARARHLEQRLADAAAYPAPALAPALLAPEPDLEPEPAIEEEELEIPPPPQPPSTRRAKPPVLQAARHGAPDDFTLIEGVSLLQQSTLYSLGIFHYDQVAAWSDEQVAWIDNYLRLRGRIDTQQWREQAGALTREGPAAARRTLAEANA